jgi:hypothetical protein
MIEKVLHVQDSIIFYIHARVHLLLYLHNGVLKSVNNYYIQTGIYYVLWQENNCGTNNNPRSEMLKSRHTHREDSLRVHTGG